MSLGVSILCACVCVDQKTTLCKACRSEMQITPDMCGVCVRRACLHRLHRLWHVLTLIYGVVYFSHCSVPGSECLGLKRTLSGACGLYMYVKTK